METRVFVALVLQVGEKGTCLLRVFDDCLVPTDFNIWAPSAETRTGTTWWSWFATTADPTD